jgi:hypothetical protein
LQVCPWDQAIEAIRSLRDDQARYRSIVDAGAASGLLYTRARIALAWQNLLYGPVRDRYLHWKSALK